MGYELHPETPPGGEPLSEHVADAEGMLAYVKTFAAGFGITDVTPPERLANTRRALAVAEHARDLGRLEALKAEVYDSYWRWGTGIETDEELAEVARRARLDPAAALAAARDPALLVRVDDARRAAFLAGVTSVPTFDLEPPPERDGSRPVILGGDKPGAPRGPRTPSRVVGCQRYEVLADAVRRAGARRRGTPVPEGDG